MFKKYSYLWYDFQRKEILGGFIIATYFFVLLMLGCLIFRATEQVSFYLTFSIIFISLRIIFSFMEMQNFRKILNFWVGRVESSSRLRPSHSS